MKTNNNAPAILTKINKFGALIKGEPIFYIDPASTSVKHAEILDIRKPDIITSGPNRGLMMSIMGIRIAKPVGLKAITEEDMKNLAKHNDDEDQDHNLYLDLVLNKDDSMAMTATNPPTVFCTTREQLEAWMKVTG